MRVNSVDHYEVLGIRRDADADAIRSAWRRLARRHHPDVATGRAATPRFIRIREAYEVLSDAERRRRYDEWLERIAPAPPRRTAAPPRPRRADPNAGAGERERGFQVDVLGIVQIGVTLGSARVTRDASDRRPGRGPRGR